MIFLRIDPFGDSRSNYILGSNAFGSQVDLRVKNATVRKTLLMKLTMLSLRLKVQ